MTHMFVALCWPLWTETQCWVSAAFRGSGGGSAAAASQGHGVPCPLSSDSCNQFRQVLILATFHFTWEFTFSNYFPVIDLHLLESRSGLKQIQFFDHLKHMKLKTLDSLCSSWNEVTKSLIDLIDPDFLHFIEEVSVEVWKSKLVLTYCMCLRIALQGQIKSF